MSSASQPIAHPPRTPWRAHALTGATLALGLWASGCQGTGKNQGGREEVELLLANGEYTQALELAAQLSEENPRDSEAEALWRRTSGAYWLDQGRRLTFEEQQEQALPAFEKAVALMPESQAARQWLEKGHAELAAIDRRLAFEAEASGELESARAHYRAALEHLPGDPSAMRGLERVDAIDAYFKERSAEYYIEGVTALRELRTAEAIQRFQAALKYLPEAVDSLERQQEVNRLLAEERTDIGRELEDLAMFRAARTEYRMAKLVVPDYRLAQEGFERADREVQVLDLLETADQKLRAEQFEASLALFDRALELSVLQKESVAALRDKADQIRIESIYARAVLLESDFRYAEAIALFDALLAEQGGFYLDARTRRDTLATYMTDAERLYNEAAQATDRATQLKLLRQVELIWPTYKDVAPRLREAAKAEQAP